MKSFFKMMLATIAGIIVTSIIFLFILVGIISAIVSSTEDKVEVKPNTILKFTFSNPIVERSDKNPLEGIDFEGFGKPKQDGLAEIVENIKKAETDDNIKGIYLELSLIPARPATLEEIRNALISFRKTGKFVVAYANYLSQGAYYLATAANKIYLNPEGSIDFMGMRSEILFFKGTLEKLGIEPQIIRHGKFKSAVEPFMSDRMSPENKEQISTLINSIWNHIVEGISTERKMSIADLNKLANNMVFADADSCLAHHAVDSLLYKDQLNEVLLKLSKNSGEKPEFIASAKYEKVPKSLTGKGLAKAKIAVVYAYGDVIMGDDGEGTVSADRISEALRTARTDTTVKAIVFRINSPGGSALASEIIWREVALASKDKPVVASMGDLAASGGYYIACAADTIMAQPNTITGSIGVFGLMFSGQKFLNQKLGITTDVAKTNEHSDFPTFSRPLDGDEKRFIQFEVDKIYETFVSHVSDGRGLSKEKVDEIGQGRVWSGLDAQKLGLVDLIGNLQDAITVAAKMAKLDNYRITSLPKLEDPLERILKDLSGDVKTNIIKSELGENYLYFEQYKNVLKSQGIQARIPFDPNIY